jgi:hypothetical protein
MPPGLRRGSNGRDAARARSRRFTDASRLRARWDGLPGYEATALFTQSWGASVPMRFIGPLRFSRAGCVTPGRSRPNTFLKARIALSEAVSSTR